MPTQDFEKYNPESSTPWKPDNPGAVSKGLGDKLFENLRESVRTINLKNAEREAGGINDKYYQLLAVRFLDAMGSDRSKITPQLIETIFSMVLKGHPSLIALYHNDERRDRPVEDRTTNAQDQTQLLKETILRMLTDTK